MANCALFLPFFTFQNATTSPQQNLTTTTCFLFQLSFLMRSKHLNHSSWAEARANSGKKPCWHLYPFQFQLQLVFECSVIAAGIVAHSVQYFRGDCWRERHCSIRCRLLLRFIRSIGFSRDVSWRHSVRSDAPCVSVWLCNCAHVWRV